MYFNLFRKKKVMNKRKKQKWIITVLILFLFNSWSVASETKLLRYPDISNSKIVFCYGGDIYTSSLEGKNVKQLTSYPGEESFPKFSPNGKQIAFTAEFEGNTDVYVISVHGGKPKRLTFHPAKDLVVDWHPDGKKILFRSIRSSFSNRFNRLHTVPVQGGLPKVLELSEAELSSYNQKGDKIAFCRISLEKMPPFKGYRGGMAPNIWTYDFNNRKAEQIIADNSINQHPMWIGNSIYFLSDRGANREQNLWVYSEKNKNLRQISFHKTWDIKSASKGNEQIIYESGGSLYIYNVNDGKTRLVKIKITSPKNSLAKTEKNVKDNLSTISLSPDGKRVLASARGELFLIDPVKNITLNLTRTPGVKEKYPKWSPDGKSYAYVSDASGEEQIYVQVINSDKKPRQITDCLKSMFRNLSWSPDGKKIGYSDHRATYYIVDIDTENIQKVFFNRYAGTAPFVSADWSADTKWLVYSNKDENWYGSIFLFSIENGKTYRITDIYQNDYSPKFDPEGKYLYWISDNKFNIETTHWDYYPYMVNTSKIIVATLKNETLSPFQAEQQDKIKQKKGNHLPIHIDIEGLGERITALPIDDSHYNYLKALKGRVLYESTPDGGDFSINMFDLNEKKESVLLKDAWDYIPAASVDKMIYRAGRMIGILDIKSGQKVGDGEVNLSGLNMTIDYHKEWMQMFNEVWRIQRDLFYDEDLNGVDWEAIKHKYETLLPHVANRSDLNYLIESMFAELGHSHTEIKGGDFPKISKENNGVLGIDLEWDTKNQFYKIAKIYRGQNWDSDRISPFTLPGLNIQEGDYLLSIDGTVLKEGVNPYALLVNKADSTVSVCIHSKPTFKDSQTVKVKPVPVSEDGNFLRYNDWVWNNIEKVNKATGGKVGYIHVPDTYYPGLESFFRYYYSQMTKQALIIDIRFNAGGFSPYSLVERLNRQHVFNFRLPHGKAPVSEPDPGFFGSKVCIANEWSESGGDMFAAIFRQLNSGLIIGKRTAGSLSSTGGFRLIDGGIIIYPVQGPQDFNGNRFIENIGVSPDIEVTNRPEDMGRGKDMQLMRSIEEIMKKLK
jgi:tricorn protease